MRWMIRHAEAVLPSQEGMSVARADIVIEDDGILAVGKDLDPLSFAVDRVVPAQDKLVMPGLVNAHLHSHDRFDKGRFDNLPLEIWMSLYNPPLTSRDWTPRQCYLRTLVNAIELIRSGTTTVVDDVHHGPSLSPENVHAVFQAYADIGLRARVSAAYADRPFYQTIPYLDEILPIDLKQAARPPDGLGPEDVLALWRDLARQWQGRVQFIVAPSGPQRCTDAFLRQTWRLAEEFGLPVIIHVLETRIQALTGQVFYGKSLVEHMQSLGILTPLSVLIHAVWVDEHDIELIACAGSRVVHNPGSNLKLGSGIAPVDKLLDAGIPVGLGTDNNNANDSANMFEAMKLAALLHKVKHGDFDHWLGARHALTMATSGGARCAGLDDRVGTIEAGKKADLVILDLNSLPFVPRNDLLNQIVYCEHGESVESVIVDGRIIMEQGNLVTVDEPSILAELMEALPAIQAMIQRTAPAGLRLEPYLRQVYDRCLEQEKHRHPSSRTPPQSRDRIAQAPWERSSR